MLQISGEGVFVQRAIPLLVAAVLLYYVFTWMIQPKLDAPTEGGFQFGRGANYAATNADEVLRIGYPKVRAPNECAAATTLTASQYRDRFFKIYEPHGETVLVPAKYLDELKALPENVLSFESEFSEVE